MTRTPNDVMNSRNAPPVPRLARAGRDGGRDDGVLRWCATRAREPTTAHERRAALPLKWKRTSACKVSPGRTAISWFRGPWRTSASTCSPWVLSGPAQQGVRGPIGSAHSANLAPSRTGLQTLRAGVRRACTAAGGESWCSNRSLFAARPSTLLTRFFNSSGPAAPVRPVVSGLVGPDAIEGPVPKLWRQAPLSASVTDLEGTCCVQGVEGSCRVGGTGTRRPARGAFCRRRCPGTALELGVWAWDGIVAIAFCSGPRRSSRPWRSPQYQSHPSARRVSISFSFLRVTSPLHRRTRSVFPEVPPPPPTRSRGASWHHRSPAHSGLPAGRRVSFGQHDDPDHAAARFSLRVRCGIRHRRALRQREPGVGGPRGQHRRAPVLCPVEVRRVGPVRGRATHRGPALGHSADRDLRGRNRRPGSGVRLVGFRHGYAQLGNRRSRQRLQVPVGRRLGDVQRMAVLYR